MKRIGSLLVVSLALLLLLTACGGTPAESTPLSTPSVTASTGAVQRESALWLDILTEPLYGSSGGIVHIESPGSQYDVSYWCIEEPQIRIGNTYIPLAEAIEAGSVTPELMVAYARMDAAAGNCREEYTSETGLSKFCYRYPKFSMQVRYDVLQTPDGKQHLVTGIMLREEWADLSASYAIYDDQLEPVDKEDWGLTYEVTEVTPTGATVRITQAGKGQHFGQLYIEEFELLSQETGEYLDSAVSDMTAWYERDRAQRKIENGATTEIKLDWQELYGAVPSGEYLLTIYVLDVYDPETLHPLTVNFQDRQRQQLKDLIIP